MTPPINIRASRPDEDAVVVDARFAGVLQAEFARLSAGLTDLTAEVIKLTAALTNQQVICNERMGKVAADIGLVREDVCELQEGRSESTKTNLRTLEAENERLKKAQSEWVRSLFFAVLGALFALLIGWLTKK